ncbi:hypothetical protein CCZ01_01240 [Helicobacter monodelphidis]|uniref:hypothetical protein n=1 Tax=Helicobacter sp. 15-1451 TaxID=2004995 RepID=UPI000DCCC899|nr:hypothetical protein [Helicobacter sp. 15-1451]RAX58848.1 hypothetical protein CCZ01_01240 [Helicobacter sp. 15-1451]
MNSWKSIDWISNTAWLLFYSVGILLFLSLFWWDYINQYRTINATYRREEVLVQQFYQEYAKITAQKKEYDQQNMQFIAKMNNSLSTSSLQSLMGNSKGVKIQSKAAKQNADILESSFSVSGTVASTKQFRDLIKSLQNSNYALEISFPIKLQSVKGGLKYTIGIKSFTKKNATPMSANPDKAVTQGGITIPASAIPNSTQ